MARRKYALVLVLLVACATAEVGTLAASKISYMSLESWTAHNMGRLSKRAVQKGLTEDEWEALKWNRDFSRKLETWARVHNLYLSIAGKGELTEADKEELIALNKQLISLMNSLREEAMGQGWEEGP